MLDVESYLRYVRTNQPLSLFLWNEYLQRDAYLTVLCALQDNSANRTTTNAHLLKNVIKEHYQSRRYLICRTQMTY